MTSADLDMDTLALLRAIYRLSQSDKPKALSFFGDLCDKGYDPKTHKNVLTALGRQRDVC
jgi:hypothetical protein